MFHVYWPPLTFLALFVAVVIMVMLKYGPRWCKLRHTTKPEEYEWEDKAYEQHVSYA